MNSTTVSADQVIMEWGKSAVKSKQTASKLAIKLAGKEPGTLVESKEKIAVELGVHQSTAQRARILLQGAGVVYKSGRHLYVSDKGRDRGRRAEGLTAPASLAKEAPCDVRQPRR
jgi:hypothetical protein